MFTVKPLTANTSAIYISRSYGYEKINEHRLDNQAFNFNFEHHFKTTSIRIKNLAAICLFTSILEHIDLSVFWIPFIGCKFGLVTQLYDLLYFSPNS